MMRQLNEVSPERAGPLLVERDGKSKLVLSALRRMIVALGGTPYQGKHSGVANLWQLLRLVGGEPRLEGQVWCGAEHVFPRGELLGKGAFARVYRSGGFALKCMERPSRGQGEVEALRRLQHPNLLALVDWWYAGGRLVLLTRLAEGQTLRSLQGKLSADGVLLVGAQLLTALAYVHSVGFVHRDVKPSNAVWSQSAAHLTLIDMGLAAASASVGSWGGTLAYSLPALWRQRGQSYPRALLECADTWAAVATLYTLLGRRPYHGVKQADELKEVFLRPDSAIVEMFGWRQRPCSVELVREQLCALTSQPSAAQLLARWQALSPSLA